MLVTCWSVKGGVGTTVVSAMLAIQRARADDAGAAVVDLGGDASAALGVSAEPPVGLADWLSAGEDVPPDALARLEIDAGPGLSVLRRGSGPLGPIERLELAAAQLARRRRIAVVDAGRLDVDDGDREARRQLAAGADRSLLVARPCYLMLRRAANLPVRPSGVVLVTERGRALGRAEVESVTGVAVVAEVAVDPVIARAVDAGLLATRLPRRLGRVLAHAA